MQIRAIESELRECRQRWAGERETWRLWKQMEQEHAEHPDQGVRAHHALCVKKARERMRWWVAARADIAARPKRAAQSSSLRRVGRLCARWREEARIMEKIADEDPDSYEARECYERAATLQDCANDLEREWAGTEPTPKLSDRGGTARPLHGGGKAEAEAAGVTARSGSLQRMVRAHSEDAPKDNL